MSYLRSEANANLSKYMWPAYVKRSRELSIAIPTWCWNTERKILLTLFLLTAALHADKRFAYSLHEFRTLVKWQHLDANFQCQRWHNTVYFILNASHLFEFVKVWHVSIWTECQRRHKLFQLYPNQYLHNLTFRQFECNKDIKFAYLIGASRVKGNISWLDKI